MRNFRSKLAAVACAALMSAQFMAATVSADSTYLYYYNGRYYESLSDAREVAGGVAGIVSYAKSKVAYTSMTTKWYADGVYYNSQEEAMAAGKAASAVYISNNNTSTPSSSYTGYWYSSYTGRVYATYSEALAASKNIASYVSRYDGYYNGYYDGYYDGYWYSSYTGKIYSTYSAAVAASGGNSSYVSRYMGNDYGYYNGYWYSSYTGKVYSTYSAALAASNNNSAYVSRYGYLYDSSLTPGSIYKYRYNGVDYPNLQAAIDAGGTVGVNIYYLPMGTEGSTTYYYYYNGTYYGSLQAAMNAGGKKLGEDITYVPYNYYGGAYNNYYYGAYTSAGVIDPYYTYRNSLTSTSTSTSGSTVSVADGEPYIYGNKKKAGWTNIVNTIKSAKNGATVKVDMNGATQVSESVLSALKGKNVNATFILSNGVRWTINGKNITNAKSLTIYTEYNIDYIPASLVKKATANSISKAQVGLTTSFDDLGTKATVSVKFSKNRAGCTAVVYRYDPDSNSLKGVSKAKVQNDGRCAFTIEAGGPYLIVLK